ncbi:alpha/beta hydrolase [Clostridium gasigenes]|uniref:alpha/beta fold hydrolase n=1 Tax=Clostridium gasigenes TaxID=94869 RepID=UPI0014382D35|nr:alpha/beta hydrolase [Clostridium gasigenes]NKF06443.1 alpha/beta hydrolase [Clostridium gasigenes]QSW20321.1 alpha/beta hydrolase [Clostridium gasigenes]
MKLLPHSNGVYKVNMRRKLKPKEIVKYVLIFITALILIGLIYQKTSDFVARETLKSKVDYTRVNDKRLDYILKGDGKYTVIFDGNLGGNLNQWTNITKELNKSNADVSTFVYNRRGYGYSDSGSKITPEEQAKDLKILLRKAGAPEPYILVGEEYGSLVLTNFAKLFPETIVGSVLINPIVEEEIKSEEYVKSNRIHKIRRKIEDIGSHIGFTSLLDAIKLDVKLEGFEDKLKESQLEEFNVQRTKANYTSAVDNELRSLMEGESNSQNPGVFEGKPYYLIAKDGQEGLQNLGSEELTKIHKTTCISNFISLEDEEATLIGIRDVIKEVNDIERKNKKISANNIGLKL